MKLEAVAHYNNLSPKLRKELEEKIKGFGKAVRYKFDISKHNPDPDKYNGEVVWPNTYTLDPCVWNIVDPYETDVKAKSKKECKTEADKTPKGSNIGRPTMGAIRVPTPAEQAELGKIAAPNKVAPPATQETPKAQSTEKPPVTPPSKPPAKQGGEPITHKMGRVRVEPAKVEPAAKPATPTKDEKAK